MSSGWYDRFLEELRKAPLGSWGRSYPQVRDALDWGYIRGDGETSEQRRFHEWVRKCCQTPYLGGQERLFGRGLREDYEMALRMGDNAEKSALEGYWQTWEPSSAAILAAVRPALVAGATVSLRLTTNGALACSVFHKDCRERFLIDEPEDTEALEQAVSEWVTATQAKASQSKSNKKRS